MLRNVLLIIFVASLFSCSNDNEDINLQRRIQTDTSAKATTILFAEPQVIDSSHIVVYPLVLERTSYGSGFSSSSGGARTSYWNLIFYNADNSTQHLLIDNKKIVIYSFKLSGNSSSSSIDKWTEGINIYKNNIFYDVVSSDFNQNKYLDIDDPTYLYVSDKQGNNFRQLSTDNYNVISWEVVTGTSKIILQAQKDNNSDKKFDQNDQVIPLVVDVSTGKIATETFSQNYIDSLKSKLSNIWKVDKK
ncbi:MAG: hypothetical protein ABJB11_10925 [Ferruginibacter sp.]